MLTQQKNEKGSLLIEIIAVLGLIALITPILFRQVQRRNDDIIDAQIASEMRAVKDAVAAYIQTDEGTLATSCGLKCPSANLVCTNIAAGEYGNTNGGELDCGITLTSAGLANFFSGGSAILDDYDYYIYGRTVKQANNSYRPVIYGVIVQKDAMPNLRRASKVASLIGLEGGVVYGGKVQGMQGVWEDSLITTPENAVVATTSFDDATNSAILKDATFQHMQASGSVQAPIVVTERLGATDILTVDNQTDDSCIANYMNDSVTLTATSDTGSACAPFFEVNPNTKEVHLRGVIKTGVSTNATCTSGTTKATCEAIQNCVWVSSANDNAGACVGEYLLNPSETSMVDDIKLGNKGGAKLSEILPNWSLKNVVYKSFDMSSSNWQVAMPLCPASYRPALIVVPSGVQSNKVLSVNTKAIAGAIRKADGTVKEDADFSSTYQDNKVTIDGATRFLISATGATPTEGVMENATGTTGTWTITPQFWVRTSEGTAGTWTNAAGTLSEGFSAVIQTYCVFVE